MCVVAMASLIFHMSGKSHFDDAGLILLGLFFLPLLLLVAQEIEMPGGIKIQLRDIKDDLTSNIESDRYTERGTIHLYTLKQYDSAISYFKKAIQLDPSNSLAIGRYASALRRKYEKTKDTAYLENAYDLIAEAIEDGHKDETLHFNRACYRSMLEEKKLKEQCKESEDQIFQDLKFALDRFDGFLSLAKEDGDLDYAKSEYKARFSKLIKRYEKPS